jgi:hypothetical protein
MICNQYLQSISAINDLKSIQNRSDRDPTPAIVVTTTFYFDSLPQLPDSLFTASGTVCQSVFATILAEKFSRLADAAYNLALNLVASIF